MGSDGRETADRRKKLCRQRKGKKEFPQRGERGTKPPSRSLEKKETLILWRVPVHRVLKGKAPKKKVFSREG